MASVPFEPIVVPIVAESGVDLPVYVTPGAAGMDLAAAEEVVLAPMERHLVPTGLRVAIPEGYEGQVRPRSGLALRKGLSMVNAPGTIDSDYRGEIGVLLINLGHETIHIHRGDRIAQLVVGPVSRVQWTKVEELVETPRSGGGFGSTGTR